MKKLIITLLVIISFSCQTEKENKLDFHLHNNLPMINAQINGMPVKLLVDTGASLSLIDTSTEFFLNFTRDYDVPVIIGDGVGGPLYIYGVKDIILEYEDKTLYVNFKGADLSDIRKNSGIVGIIGADYLSQYNLVIDFYNRKIIQGALE